MTQVQTEQSEQTESQTQVQQQQQVDGGDFVNYLKEETVSNLPKGFVEKFKGKTVDDVILSHVNLEKLIGSMAKIPAPDAPDEELHKLYSRLGMPKRPEDYEVSKPENLPEGFGYDENLENAMRSVSHKAGLTNRQFKMLAEALTKYNIDYYQQQSAQQLKLLDENKAKLASEWGIKKDENLNIAKRAFNKFAPKELKEIMKPDDIDNDYILANMYLSIGKAMLDDKFIAGSASSSSGSDTIEYRPRYYHKDSAHFYENDNSEEGRRARQWHRQNNGYVYSRND